MPSYEVYAADGLLLVRCINTSRTVTEQELRDLGKSCSPFEDKSTFLIKELTDQEYLESKNNQDSLGFPRFDGTRNTPQEWATLTKAKNP